MIKRGHSCFDTGGKQISHHSQVIFLLSGALGRNSIAQTVCGEKPKASFPRTADGGRRRHLFCVRLIILDPAVLTSNPCRIVLDKTHSTIMDLQKESVTLRLSEAHSPRAGPQSIHHSMLQRQPQVLLQANLPSPRWAEHPTPPAWGQAARHSQWL